MARLCYFGIAICEDMLWMLVVFHVVINNNIVKSFTFMHKY